MLAMRRKKRLKILTGLFLYIAAIQYGMAAYGTLRYTQIVLDQPIPVESVQRIQEQEREREEPVGVCFWGEFQKQTVICKETGGAAAVTPVLLAGNPVLMFADRLAWQHGCLVDEKTARDLFGTTSVESQVLWYREQPYPVLGIAEAVRPTMVLMADMETKLERAVLTLSPERGAIEGESCLIRWGIQGTILDATLMRSLICNSFLIFPVILVSLACARLKKDWKGITWDTVLYGRRLDLLGKALLSAVLLFGAVWFLGSQIVIPDSMIPSKWSDFSFWQRWWQSERENAIEILFTPMGNSQLQMALNVVKSVVANSCACSMLIWSTRR